MKSRLNKKNIRLRKDEAGYALMWVLVVIILAGIILVPLFLLMTAGLTSSHAHEERMLRFYAADAGVEAAIRQLVNGPLEVNPFDLNVNASNVNVTVGVIGDTTYGITSIATRDGRDTVIKCEVSATTYDFFDNAITSRGNVTLQPGGIVEGVVQYNGTLDEKGTIIGDKITDNIYDWQWPTAQELHNRYYSEAGSYPYASNTIDVKTKPDIGPLYRAGSLEIKSSQKEPVIEATLGGTVYVTGDLIIGQVAQDFILNLNNQTIYVEGTVRMSDKCTITGTGCIIAVGDVFFLPKLLVSPPNFIFIMSINGTVTFQPMGNFYGSVAGNVEVDLLPNNQLVWVSPPAEGLNFPSIAVRADYDVITYNIE
jgi:archaellum component FlaF (FlaF/FlaG flagellin family)